MRKYDHGWDAPVYGSHGSDWTDFGSGIGHSGGLYSILSGGLLSGGLEACATDFGSGIGHSGGLYSLGVYILSGGIEACATDVGSGIGHSGSLESGGIESGGLLKLTIHESYLFICCCAPISCLFCS